jgi:zinc and cadmium transporter
MISTISLTLISVILISLISFIGIFTFTINQNKLKKILLYFVSFAAGALLGDTFIHLIPETVEKSGFSLTISLYLLLGFGIFFVLEKYIHWEHCHGHFIHSDHTHPFALMSLIGDGLHNLIDGIIIAAAYLVSIPTGIATTIAVALHEIPQEFGDYSILLHGGFSKSKALLLNFGSALIAILGAIIALSLSSSIPNIELILIPIAAGGFIYIAAADLIPELHKETKLSRSIMQLISLVLGVLAMLALLLIG